jgi:hypothetical protein
MSRLADAAYDWLKENAPTRRVTSRELWDGLRLVHPDLTASSEARKTPYNTLMRDIRFDVQKRFIVGGGFVALTMRSERGPEKF